MPGGSDGKRYAPPLSLTPVVVPATRAVLVSVMVTPGPAAPCSSDTRTRMLPVCTCAAMVLVAPSPMTHARVNHAMRNMLFPPDRRTPGGAKGPHRAVYHKRGDPTTIL